MDEEDKGAVQKKEQKMTAKELRDIFFSDLQRLQDSCKHEDAEEMECHLFPGHSIGAMVRVCKLCEKTLENNNGGLKWD